MMAHWLRLALAAQALLLAAAAALLGDRAPPAWVALAACAALPILSAAVVAAVYAVLRRYAQPRPATGARPWECAAGELLALFAAFAVIQPFERWWMGADAAGRGRPGRWPVLLVHGYLCNRGMWWWLRRRLRADGYAVATVNLEPVLSGLDELAARLDERIEALLAETGAERVVLVTHSMGGLVARACLRQRGARGVAGLVTLAAPHHGTRIARLGPGRNARQMRPGSDWLRDLNRAPLAPVPAASIWSMDDEINDPPDSGRLPGARQTVVSGVGHVAMAFSPAVLACLQTELALLAPATSACPSAAAQMPPGPR